MTDNAVALFRQFRTELDVRADKIAAQLPKHISRDRFLYFAAEAVTNLPQLLTCNRVSLHAAILKAVRDELLPDGREGVIVPRSGLACWQPMVHGIRKVAARCGVIIDGKVVCKNDHFEWEEGMQPILRHKPTPLDQDPGDMIGAYAIFRRNGEVLHHEVMRRAQVLAVKSISKQQDGIMWSKFEDQAWVKTVVRRGSKSVPDLPEHVQRVIERHDDDYRVRGEDDDPPPQINQDEDNGRDPLADPDGTPPVDGEDLLDASEPIANGKVTTMAKRKGAAA